MADVPKYDPPKPSTGASAHSLATALLSMIPGVTERFEYLVKPPEKSDGEPRAHRPLRS